MHLHLKIQFKKIQEYSDYKHLQQLYTNQRHHTVPLQTQTPSQSTKVLAQTLAYNAMCHRDGVPHLVREAGEPGTPRSKEEYQEKIKLVARGNTYKKTQVQQQQQAPVRICSPSLCLSR